MGENSKIEWTHHTFNPWIGCQKVSPGCDFCYAEDMMDKRYKRVQWGPHGERVRTSAANWRKPYAWAKHAGHFEEMHGERQRVFCASLADVFDNKVPEEWRIDLWRLIAETPQLDWMLLTKRPENIQGYLPPDSISRAYGLKWPWPHVWLGASTEDHQRAEHRLPILLGIEAAIHFASAEPLLGRINFRRLMIDDRTWLDAMTGVHSATAPSLADLRTPLPPKKARLRLVITGGESGPNARPMNPQWARDIRDQCAASFNCFLHKQNGEFASVSEVEGEGRHHTFDDHRTVRRVGKTAAGRLLDGRTHDEMPNVRRAGE